MIIIDTHIFVWSGLEQYKKIPKETLAKINGSKTLGVSAISLWEISMLVQKGRIEFPCELLTWFRLAFISPKLKLLPITPEIAVISGTLQMHGDPADRIIAATSIVHKCELATVDEKLYELDFLNVL